jgi:hypothetical protein
MSGSEPDGAPRAGGWTAATGTPVPVDISRDRPARIIWIVFLAGPVTWFTHFMFVYLIAEAGCTGDGPGLDAFDPPVPAAVTLTVTAAAALVCLAASRWAYGRWQAERRSVAVAEPPELPRHVSDHDRGGALSFAGMLLSLFSFVAVLFVGFPALVFEC